MKPTFQVSHKRALIDLDPKYWGLPENELMLIARIKDIIKGGDEFSEGPFGPRQPNEGYCWQLDSSNDWWVEVYQKGSNLSFDNPDDSNEGVWTMQGPTLLLACRYDYQAELFPILLPWIAHVVGPRD